MIFQSIRLVYVDHEGIFNSIICVATISHQLCKRKKGTPTTLQFILPSLMHLPNKKIVNDLAELSVAAPIDVFSLTSLSGNRAGSIIQLSSSEASLIYTRCTCICTSLRFFLEGCTCMAPQSRHVVALHACKSPCNLSPRLARS